MESVLYTAELKQERILRVNLVLVRLQTLSVVLVVMASGGHCPIINPFTVRRLRLCWSCWCATGSIDVLYHWAVDPESRVLVVLTTPNRLSAHFLNLQVDPVPCMWDDPSNLSKYSFNPKVYVMSEHHRHWTWQRCRQYTPAGRSMWTKAKDTIYRASQRTHLDIQNDTPVDLAELSSAVITTHWSY